MRDSACTLTSSQIHIQTMNQDTNLSLNAAITVLVGIAILAIAYPNGFKIKLPNGSKLNSKTRHQE